MREINFTEVGMENFGPYIDPMVLTFENNKLTLITGPNGIGKTMSLEAIPYTLFGATSKGAKGDDVVNTIVGKNCHTWVKFSINSDNYLVDRYHKYKRLGNTVIISKNGEDPYLKGHREVLPEVEKLICSKKSFTNTLMFGQKVKDFFTDLVDSDKKEIFRKILELDIYTQWYKQADTELKKIKENIRQLSEQIGIKQGILNEVDTQIAILFKQFQKFEENKKEKISEIQKSLEENQRLLDRWKTDKQKVNTVDIDTEQLKTQITDLEKQIDHHEGEKTTTILQLNHSAESKISEMREAANEATEKITSKFRKDYDIYFKSHTEAMKELRDKYDDIKSHMLENSNKLTELTTEKRICKNTIDNLHDSLKIDDGVCPTCLRDIDENCRDHLEKEVLTEINRYKDFERKEKTITKSQETYQILLDQNTEHQSKENKQFEDARKQLTIDEEKEKSVIQEKIKSIVQKINDRVENEALKIEEDYKQTISELKQNLKQLQEKQKEILKNTEVIKEIDSTIEKLEANIANQEMQLKKIEEDTYDKSQLEMYQLRKKQFNLEIEEIGKKVIEFQKEEKITEFWKKAWSPTGIPSMLIDDSIPFINKKVSEYLEKLTNGRYIVSFDTLSETKSGEFRDKISVNVLDTYTRANSRIQLSGGQTRIIDIATILTLRDLQSNIKNVNINILLFDEIFDSLDDENITFVSKILYQIKLGKAINLISHTQVDQLEPDEVLELK